MLLREAIKQPTKNHKYSHNEEEYFLEFMKALNYFNPDVIVNKKNIITPDSIHFEQEFRFN